MVARLGDDVVVQRPDGVVAEALVVELDIRHRQGNWHDADSVVVEGRQLQIGLTGPADPGAVGGAHHGLEGRHQTAGRLPPGRRTGLVDDAVDGETIRDDNKGIQFIVHADTLSAGPRPEPEKSPGPATAPRSETFARATHARHLR